MPLPGTFSIMGTRAAAFAAKIRNLRDYHQRLINNSTPLPTGSDIAITLRWFSQTLLGVLKDVPGLPLLLIRTGDKNGARPGLLPCLDYKGLYHTLVSFFEVTPLIPSGTQVFGSSILHVCVCLMAFLDNDLLATLPWLISSALSVFPPILHADIVTYLCYYFLPVAMGPLPTGDAGPSQVHLSVPAMMMMVFQYTTNTEFHCQLVETLLALKRDVAKDLLCVIAHGTAQARPPAANLLFFYWPSLNPTIYDRRGVHMKFNGWKALSCQRDQCVNRGEADAVKLCLDHAYSIAQHQGGNLANLAPGTLSLNKPPLLYMCEDCADELRRLRLQTGEGPGVGAEDHGEPLIDGLLPMQQVAVLCENKNCRSSDKTALITCFAPECAGYNGNKPIRYCAQCTSIRHNNRRGGDHVLHGALPKAWDMDSVMQNYVIEAIVSLLKEAQAQNANAERGKEGQERLVRAGLLNSNSGNGGNEADSMGVAVLGLEERRLLSRYGVWLLVALVPPNPLPEVPPHVLPRLLAMIIQWFHATAYVSDDQSGGVLERLKSDYLHDWISQVAQNHFDVVSSCLMPHPPPAARVAGSWDTLEDSSSCIREGFQRLFCLVPYDLISAELWNHVMPHWLEAMAKEMPEEEVAEIRGTLSKLLDADMSPLGMEPPVMFRFMHQRFQYGTPAAQVQVLRWLQVLTLLGIPLPLPLLISMMREGVLAHSAPPTDVAVDVLVTDADSRASSPTYKEERFEKNLASRQNPISDAEQCWALHLLMLDVMCKQVELQEIPKHCGLQTPPVNPDLLLLLRDLVRCKCAGGLGPCIAADNPDCYHCTETVLFYQLLAELLHYVAPAQTTFPQEESVLEEELWDMGGVSGSSAASSSAAEKRDKEKDTVNKDKEESKGGTAGLGIGLGIGALPGGSLVSMSQAMTQGMTMQARFETVADIMDLAPSMPAEKVLKAVAKAVTLTETDVAIAKVQVATTTLVGENDEPLLGSGSHQQALGEEMHFWHTSHGKFKVILEELPASLQLIFALLQELGQLSHSEAQCHLLNCLSALCLHGDALSRAAKDHRGFLVWTQENLTIPQLWQLLASEHSEVGCVGVALLCHCLSLPAGVEVLWRLMEEAHSAADWSKRLTLLDQLNVLTQFLHLASVQAGGTSLQCILSHALVFLVSALDDLHTFVAHKALVTLETMHDTALQSLIWCAEQQFDSVIVDRPVILQTLYMLYNTLPQRRILTWKFFMHRMDALFLEAQLQLQKLGDIAYPRDLKNSDMNSDAFVKKLQRAQEALRWHETLCSESALSTSSSKLSLVRSVSLARGRSSHRLETKGAQKETSSYVNTTREHRLPRLPLPPLVKQRSSRFGMDGQAKGAMVGGPEDAHVCALLQRAQDSDDFDAETLHYLIFVFMQFIARPEQAVATDDKLLNKMQHLVLRHLSLLLGYNASDRAFCVTPFKLRSSAIFYSFVANLPQVLDHNLEIGSTLLPLALALLNHASAPSTSSLNVRAQQTPSLWYLEPHPRRLWLHALLVILYKYHYNAQPVASAVHTAVRLVLYSLEAQFHRCPVMPGAANVVQAPLGVYRSREQSQASLGSMGGAAGDPDTPQEPGWAQRSAAYVPRPSLALTLLGASGGPSEMDDAAGVMHRRGLRSTSSGTGRAELKSASSISSGAEEIEPELEAIPESPKTGSPSASLSPQGSLDKVFSEELRVLDWPEVNSSMRSVAKARSTPAKPSESRENEDVLQQGATVGTLLTACVQSTPAPPIYEAHVVTSTTHHNNKVPASLPQALKFGVAASVAVLEPAIRTAAAVPSTQDEETSGARPRQRKMASVVPPSASSSRTCDPDPWLSSLGARNWVPSPRGLSRLKQSSLRVGEDCIVERCPGCHGPIQYFPDEDLSLCVVIIATYVHREPGMAASLLPEMLRTAAKVSVLQNYSWQGDNSVYVPGSAPTVARQFLRCVLHQLTPNRVFLQLFRTTLPDGVKTNFFKTVTVALADFTELNPLEPLQFLLDALNEDKHLAWDDMPLLLENVATYLECLASETATPPSPQPSPSAWAGLLNALDVFLARLILLLPPALMNSRQNAPQTQLAPSLLRILTCGVRAAAWANHKALLDTFGKTLSFLVQHYCLDHTLFMETCSACFKSFSRDREKLALTKAAVTELVSALKFKIDLPESNWFFLVQMVLQDAGGFLSPHPLLADEKGSPSLGSASVLATGASECLRLHINDILDFLTDVHALSKIKNTNQNTVSSQPSNVNWGGANTGMHEDTLGGCVKAGLAQWLALDVGRNVAPGTGTTGNAPIGGGAIGAKDSRALTRYLPWLLTPPSSLQQGPREFLECVSHMRLLSWLLLGALQHQTASPVVASTASTSCTLPTPLPLECSCPLADHVQAVFAGFAEQSKTSVLHMSSLFHAFLLCQLWTIYLEQMARLQYNNASNSTGGNSGSANDAQLLVFNVLVDFWAKVTPSILQLLAHSKVLAEMVNLHFLSLMETLAEVDSTLLTLLLPVWTPVLHAYGAHLPSHLQVRHQACLAGGGASAVNSAETANVGNVLAKWLRRLQFKMGQMELQSSAATQFYTI